MDTFRPHKPPLTVGVGLHPNDGQMRLDQPLLTEFPSDRTPSMPGDHACGCMETMTMPADYWTHPTSPWACVLSRWLLRGRDR